MDRVANAVFSLLFMLDEKGISMARVARSAKVSRPWIYKYIATNKEELIRFAILCTGKALTERDKELVVANRKEFVESILLGMKRMFQNTEQYPFFIPVYFKYKGTSGIAGQTIDLVEQAYNERQAKLMHSIFKMPNRAATFSAEMLTTFRMGLAFNWQRGTLKNKAREDELLGALQGYFESLFG